ncbi:MAG: hypothetical protein DRJ37_02575 [Thermoprotei archaeon]|nr:MAG: hypothetical protein DRJ37_02575 [Thermoprotei archaeon]
MKLEKIVESLQSLFEKEKLNIKYVVLFGSLSRGYLHSLSDIDLGLRVGEKVNKLEITTKAVLELASKLKISEDILDVVVFNSSDISKNLVFFYELLAKGILIWGDREVYLEDLTRVSLLYSDYKIQLVKTGYFAKYVESLGEKVRAWES